MADLGRGKAVFVSLGLVSIGCLIGSFASPLQKLEVWGQTEKNAFNVDYKKIFVVTETDDFKPWDFDKRKAFKIAQVYQDAKLSKVVLLAISMLSAGLALNFGEKVCLEDEVMTEVKKIENEGQKELLLSRLKNRLALASKAEQLLARETLKELLSVSGGEETMEATEVNATDKFVNAMYLLQEGHPVDEIVVKTWGYKPGTEQHQEMKQKFQQWMETDHHDLN